MAEYLGQQTTNAPGLSRSSFMDEEVLKNEFQRIFRKTWQLIGFESELPCAGDYVVRRFGNDNVILARTEDFGLTVMLNSCTHRGTQLCRATFGNSANFRCSYHGWTFGNDGRLVGVPSIRSAYPPDFDKRAYDLPRARTAAYGGFIFATWNTDGPSLGDYLGDFRWYLDAMLALGGGEWEVFGPPQRAIMAGNWKIVTDNFAGDGYHMQTTHQAAFEQGVFGETIAGGTLGHGELELIGVNIGTPQGHVVRSGYVVKKGERKVNRDIAEPVYIGYPREYWPRFTAAQTPEQVRFNSHTEVVHGAVFPNAAFLSVSHDRAIGRDDDPLTKYTVWRTHTPIDARRTECTYWTLMPKMMSEEWKQRSYSFQARSQSAGGLLFEMDDYDNFARINRVIGGGVAAGAPTDLSLGWELGEQVPDFPGPGRAEYSTLSEQNQRTFYQRWARLMEDS